jgi:hypothetical protein
MQRNMELVRNILMWIENSPSGWTVPPFSMGGFMPEQVAYHVHIMREDGLIEGSDRHTLTWKGHEFLDLARDQKRWNQAKIAIGKVGSAPIAVWMKVLQDLIFKDLGVAS